MATFGDQYVQRLIKRFVFLRFGSSHLFLSSGFPLHTNFLTGSHPDAEEPQHDASIRRHGDELERYGSQMRHLDAELERYAALKPRCAAELRIK